MKGRSIYIKNLNSREIANYYIDLQSIVAKLDYLVHKAFKLTLYLVDENLMDVLYPPYKRRLLNEEVAEELLNPEKNNLEEEDVPYIRIEKMKEKMERLFSKYHEPGSPKSQIIVAVGLYLHNKSSMPTSYPEEFEDFIKSMETPCVVICPERVVEWAQSSRVSVNTVFELVYFHELAHAFIHSKLRNYQKPWYRIVEEAYCNAVAIKRFKTEKEISDAKTAIQSQPVEYRGYTVFTNSYLFHPFYPPYNHFYRDFEAFLEDFYFYLRRFRRHPFWREEFFPIFFRPLVFDEKYFEKIWKSNYIPEEYFVTFASSILGEVLGYEVIF